MRRMRMKKRNESADEEYQVLWLVDGCVSLAKRYGCYEDAWKEFSRLSRPACDDDELREAVFRIRRSGGEWKEAARCTVGPRPDEPPMPRIVVTSEWGFGTAEDAAYVDGMWLGNEIFEALAERHSGNQSLVESIRWETIGGKEIRVWKRTK